MSNPSGMIYVVLDYRIDGEPVTYGREVAPEQLAQLVAKLDELADDNE